MKTPTQPCWHAALTSSSHIPSMIRLWSYWLQPRRYPFVAHPQQYMEISVNVCVLTCLFYLCVYMNKVPSSPGVVCYPELDHHRGAGRENDCNWFKRLVWRGPKGAVGEHSWLLHASEQLSPGHQEIHTGGQQAQGITAVCLYGFSLSWEHRASIWVVGQGIIPSGLSV